jgi:hypothetical protein
MHMYGWMCECSNGSAEGSGLLTAGSSPMGCQRNVQSGGADTHPTQIHKTYSYGGVIFLKALIV